MSKKQASKPETTRKIKVAAYCRVSTDHEEQQDSFFTQVNHYTKFIQENPVWEFAGIFADEGISGTSKTKRLDFLRLINECEKGKIDMVITKSISRFARNTVDCIETVRRLKTLGVTVFFERENINTLSTESELFLTILSSVAQEESMSKSRSIKWRHEVNFKNGIINQAHMPYGYLDVKGEKFIIDPVRSEVVKRIFHDYLNGKSSPQIAKELTKEQVPTEHNGGFWSTNVVLGMLKNERYIGDLLLQKTYIVDNDPTFKLKINKGEKNKYYVTDNHTPIILKSDFEKVQRLLNLQPLKETKRNNNHWLSGKIICGLCGKVFSKKISKSKYSDHSKVYFTCHNKTKNYEICQNKQVTEDEICHVYKTMLQKLQFNNTHILKMLQSDLKKIAWDEDNDSEINTINNQLLQLAKQGQILSRLRSQGSLDSAIFMDKSDELNMKMNKLKQEKSTLMKNQEEDDRLAQTDQLIKRIEQMEVTTDEEMNYDAFFSIIKIITINSDKEVCFTLTNGLTLTEKVVK